MFKLSSSSKKRREGVDPKLIEIDDLAIQLALVLTTLMLSKVNKQE